MKVKNVLVTYTKPVTEEDRLTVAKIRSVLTKNKIRSSFILRRNLKEKDFKNRNLIIAVGGDGTFLKAALFIRNNLPIMGVNSDIEMKEGFFMCADRKNFETKFPKLIKGKYKIKKLARLEAYINNKKINDIALNEFYIGADKEYITSRYYIQVGNTIERHKSSGLLIATPAGSYAWISSCGGKKLRVTTKKFEYVVREPYKGRTNGKYKLKKGILSNGRYITVISDMSKGYLIADSLSKEYFFKKNDKIRVGLSKKDLRVVFF